MSSATKNFSAAFTLIEIMVVVVIVGILSAAALPKMGTVIERFRAKEGEQFLIAIYASEQRYAVDNFRKTCSAYPCSFWTSNFTAIDFDNSRKPPNFSYPYYSAGETAPIRINRMSGSTTLYTLAIGFDGRIICLNNATLCAKMKYN
ncbi:MAG TPA: prepilin-type N-terminal cleavage/methylation domain-containing protein [Candidatus Omnitrophota bacterium]|nr:prepilin-type N-terminal cleavage/methylation domain-containing protein [Candidatus Omnitrophota bacterium]